LWWLVVVGGGCCRSGRSSGLTIGFYVFFSHAQHMNFKRWWTLFFHFFFFLFLLLFFGSATILPLLFVSILIKPQQCQYNKPPPQTTTTNHHHKPPPLQGLPYQQHFRSVNGIAQSWILFSGQGFFFLAVGIFFVHNHLVRHGRQHAGPRLVHQTGVMLAAIHSCWLVVVVGLKCEKNMSVQGYILMGVVVFMGGFKLPSSPGGNCGFNVLPICHPVNMDNQLKQSMLPSFHCCRVTTHNALLSRSGHSS
jgi:hypothetical protein